MNKQLLLEFAQLKTEEKKIKTRIEEIKDSALEEVMALKETSDQPIALMEFPENTFTIRTVKVWEYSPTCQALEKKIEEMKVQLDEMKKVEQQMGDAKPIKEIPSLVFK